MSVAVDVMLVLAYTVHSAWVYSAVYLTLGRSFGWPRPAWVRWFFHETRPFYLPAVLVEIGDWSLRGTLLGWNTLAAAVALAAWWWFKDADEDDRWRRRLRKVAEKIARAGARLVVVPAGGDA